MAKGKADGKHSPKVSRTSRGNVKQKGTISQTQQAVQREFLLSSGRDPSAALQNQHILMDQRQGLVQNLGRIGGNRELGNMIARQANQEERTRPTLPQPTTFPENMGQDPVAESTPEVQEQWAALDHELREMRLKLKQAQDNYGAWDPVRANWHEEANALSEQLVGMSSESVIAQTRASYEDLNNRIFDASIPANTEWEEVKDQTAGEMAGVLSGEGGLGGLYAYDYLKQAFERTQNRLSHIDSDVLVSGDFKDLKVVIAKKEHIWRGETRAAVERAWELIDMLNIVGELRGSGENADKMVPGWRDRVLMEQRQLIMLASVAPDFEDQKTFMVLEEKLTSSMKDAMSRKPTEMGFLDKANALVKGGLSAIADPFVEAGKQAVDLIKISAYGYYSFFGGESWEPELSSDMAKAADKEGLGTWDLIKGMGVGIIETPERVYDAVKRDDWEAIGREAVNLYMLGKAAKAGLKAGKQVPAKLAAASARAQSVIQLVRIRMIASGRSGGMPRAAIYAVQEIAKKHGLEILIRPVEKAVIRLREMGHPGKIKELKMKTIKEIDTYLGASADDIGKVGFFEPVLPENVLGLPKKTAIAVADRYTARMQEWRTMQGDVQKLATEGVAELRGKVIVEKSSGKAYTGDGDIFELKQGGKNVNYDSLSENIRASMEREPIGTRHGDHVSWDNIQAGQAEIFANIVKSHRPGGEALIKFTPDGKVVRQHFDD